MKKIFLIEIFLSAIWFTSIAQNAQIRTDIKINGKTRGIVSRSEIKLVLGQKEFLLKFLNDSIIEVPNLDSGEYEIHYKIKKYVFHDTIKVPEYLGQYWQININTNSDYEVFKSNLNIKDTHIIQFYYSINYKLFNSSESIGKIGYIRRR